MDAATFDCFLGLLDAHWTSSKRWVQMADELNAWLEVRALRRTGNTQQQQEPLRQFTAHNLAYFCRNALSRYSLA
jgi:hypothetical protein